MRHLRLDPTLVIAVLALAILGTVMVFSASAVRADNEHGGDGYYYFKRQIFFLMVGIMALVLGAAIPYEVWEKSVVGLLALTVILLVLVLTPLGHTANNASRWFRIGPISLQIGEFAKLVVVMYMARYLAARGERLRSEPRLIIPPLVVMCVVFFLVAKEPDLGTAMFIGMIVCAMLFIAALSAHLARRRFSQFATRRSNRRGRL